MNDRDHDPNRARQTAVPAHPASEGDDRQSAPRPDPAVESAEEIHHGSQTAQDREHTIRGGDDLTAPAKEFPT